MASKEYTEKAEHLLKATEIAIIVTKECPPKGFNSHHVEIVVNSYNQVKESLLNPNPKYMNLGSLKYKIQDVFTYFNEASGPTVDLFWKRLKEQNLPYERENKLEKILAKRKIRNQIEYDYVIDTMVPFKQEGMISEEDFKLLNELIGEFEQKKIKKK